MRRASVSLPRMLVRTAGVGSSREERRRAGGCGALWSETRMTWGLKGAVGWHAQVPEPLLRLSGACGWGGASEGEGGACGE